MPKRKKLVEKYWVIRIGTFRNSQPYFLLEEGSKWKPRLFKSRAMADGFREGYASKSDYAAWTCKSWAVVPVDLGER